MTREEILKDFDEETGYFLNNPIDVLHIARAKFLSLLNDKERLEDISRQLRNDKNDLCTYVDAYRCPRCKRLSAADFKCQNCGYDN